MPKAVPIISPFHNLSAGDVADQLGAVKAEIAGKRLEIVLKNLALSPERLGVYYAKGKRLPAKTAEFIAFLQSSLGES